MPPPNRRFPRRDHGIPDPEERERIIRPRHRTTERVRRHDVHVVTGERGAHARQEAWSILGHHRQDVHAVSRPPPHLYVGRVRRRAEGDRGVLRLRRRIEELPVARRHRPHEGADRGRRDGGRRALARPAIVVSGVARRVGEHRIPRGNATRQHATTVSRHPTPCKPLALAARGLVGARPRGGTPHEIEYERSTLCLFQARFVVVDSSVRRRVYSGGNSGNANEIVASPAR
jgi:hypothetical protein